MPQSVCVTTAVRAELAVVADARGRTRSAASRRRASARPRRCIAAVAGCLAPRVERNTMSWRFRTSSSIVCWMFALSSSPSACIPPVPLLHAQRGRVGVELDARRAGSSPSSSVACQAVTWRSRSCPALAAAPPRLVRTASVAFPGPSRCVPAGSDMRRAYIGAHPTQEQTAWPSSWIILHDREADRRELRGDHRPRARRARRRGRQRARDAEPRRR